MSILGSYLMSKIRGSMSGPGPEDDEQKKTYQKLIEGMLNEKNYSGARNLLDQMDSKGAPVATTPYRQFIQAQSPGSVAASEMLNEPQYSTQPLKSSGLGENASFDLPGGVAQGQERRKEINRQKQSFEEIFTPEFIQRAQVKQAANIDIKSKATDTRWFRDYAALGDMPATERKELLASKYGYIPEAAIQLKDLPLEERQALAEQKIWSIMTDPKIDEQVRKAHPDLEPEKVKLAFVLQRMAQDGEPIPEKFTPFLEQMTSLRDDFVILKTEEASALEGAKTGAKIGAEYALRGEKAATEYEREYQTGLAKERVAEETFKGKLGRETTKAKEMREINKPRLTEGALARIDAGKTFSQLSKRMTDTVLGFVQTDKGIDLNLLPTGPMEIVRKQMDKFGINADEERIKLRTGVFKLVELMYQIRGKQLSDKEQALALEVQSSMSESPIQFVTKFSEFQRSLIAGVNDTIEVRRKAGLDVGELPEIADQLNKMPLLDEQVGTGTNARQQSPQQQTAPKEAIEHLRKNPETREQFREIFGYVPEGL
jgi:pentatricopeptide repeat protein